MDAMIIKMLPDLFLKLCRTLNRSGHTWQLLSFVLPLQDKNHMQKLDLKEKQKRQTNENDKNIR